MSSFVLWLTGLSGAGKSTVGEHLYRELKPRRRSLVFLDGDLFREIIGDSLGHDPKDRLENAYRLSRLCRYLSRQDISVICCTMSLYPEIWKWNRQHIPGYLQIYLKVGRDTVTARDPKGLYAKLVRGEERNVVGWDLPFTEPEASDLTIENDESGAEAVVKASERIHKLLKERNLVLNQPA